MEDEIIAKCEICGVEADHAFEIEIFHRGCRFKAMFPNAYEERNGFLFFDPKKMREAVETDGTTAD